MHEDFAAEETDNPHIADLKNFYKVERWSKDGQHIERMLYAGNRIDRAREVFEQLVHHRPGGRYTIRQGIRVLHRWPEE
jgi:hypothetical protein